MLDEYPKIGTKSTGLRCFFAEVGGQVRGKSPGFALLELVVAVAVLALAAGPVLGLLAAAAGLSAGAGMFNEAACLARSKLEEMKSAGYEVVSGGEEVLGAYKRLAEVREVGEKELKLKQLTVIVTWSFRETQREYSLTTYLARR